MVPGCQTYTPLPMFRSAKVGFLHSENSTAQIIVNHILTLSLGIFAHEYVVSPVRCRIAACGRGPGETGSAAVRALHSCQ